MKRFVLSCGFAGCNSLLALLCHPMHCRRLETYRHLLYDCLVYRRRLETCHRMGPIALRLPIQRFCSSFCFAPLGGLSRLPVNKVIISANHDDILYGILTNYELPGSNKKDAGVLSQAPLIV